MSRNEPPNLATKSKCHYSFSDNFATVSIIVLDERRTQPKFNAKEAWLRTISRKELRLSKLLDPIYMEWGTPV